MYWLLYGGLIGALLMALQTLGAWLLGVVDIEDVGIIDRIEQHIMERGRCGLRRWTSSQLRPGFCTTDLCALIQRGRPLLLLLDEFDTAVDQAQQADHKGDRSSLADDPASLLGFLDRLADLDNLYVVATTNRPREEFPPQYVRRGRFNVWVDVKSKEGCTIEPAQ